MTESIKLSCLLPLSVLIRVRKQGGAENRSKRADVFGYPHTSSLLLASVYSCISSASLRPQLGVSYSVTQVTHLEAACCAGKEEMLCNLDTCEKRPTQMLWLWNIGWFDCFHTCFPSISLRSSGIFIFLSTLTPLQFHCRSGFSSFMQFDLFDCFFSSCLFSQSWGSICNTCQHVYCICMHSSTSKTWLRTRFLPLFTVPFVCFFRPSKFVLQNNFL